MKKGAKCSLYSISLINYIFPDRRNYRMPNQYPNHTNELHKKKVQKRYAVHPMLYVNVHIGPVCWEGDVSEPLFDFSKGYALLKNDDQRVTQESRQHAFNQGLTTDDHTMEIIGIAHDNHGKKYYLCKNSWGEDNPYNGYMYLSENYVRAKTIAIMLPAAALPTWDEMMPR